MQRFGEVFPADLIQCICQLVGLGKDFLAQAGLQVHPLHQSGFRGLSAAASRTSGSDPTHIPKWVFG